MLAALTFGERPTIEKVHYFGFVLQICAPDRIPQADRVGIATPTTARAADPTHVPAAKPIDAGTRPSSADARRAVGRPLGRRQ